jgi:signal transduction histidine kinase
MRVAVKSTDLTVRADPANIWMRFSDDGTPNASEESTMLLASMRHRIRVLGGKVEVTDNEAGATALTVWMPLRQGQHC